VTGGPAGPWGDADAAVADLRRLSARGGLGAAAAAAAAAASRWPEEPELAFLAGRAAIEAGDFAAAVPFADAAVAARPARATWLFEAALARHGAGRADEAADLYRRLLEAVPGHPDALNNLANLRRAAGDAEEAAGLYARAVAVRPANPEAWHNLGSVRLELGEGRPAVEALRRAAEQAPTRAATWLNLAQALDLEGLVTAAGRAYERAAQLAGGDAAVLCALATRALAQGRWAEGWADWPLRWADPGRAAQRAAVGLPAWAPGAAGPTLVWAEQGVGEEILFSGLVSAAEGRIDRPVVEVDPRLVPLFRRSRPGWRVEPRARPRPAHASGCAVAAAFGDLAALFPDAPLPEVPPFLADPDRAAGFRRWLDGLPPGPRVGLSWASPMARMGRIKGVGPDDLAPVLATGAAFVSLQYAGPGGRPVPEALAGRVAEAPGLDARADLDGLAALIAGLDAVVTTCSATAHLAAAMRRPVVVMAPRGPGLQWYWGEAGAALPWYPTATLVRQQPGMSSADLCRAAAAALAARLA
jgi:tetratricopeptide (TPR) repeat protein